MPARVSRVSAGIAEKASTTPGMTKCCHEPVPEIGSQPSCRPNTIIRIRPSQNDGIAWPSSATIWTARSSAVFSRTAARMPSGSETSSAITRPVRPSVRVTGMRSPISVATRAS